MKRFLDEYCWRDRADEVRAASAGMKDPISRGIMEGIAQGYDRLAVHAAANNRVAEHLQVFELPAFKMPV